MPYRPVRSGPQIPLRDRGTLETALRAADLNGAELARAAGITRQYVSRLRSGERLSARYEVAAAVERALRVTPGTLFDYAPAGPDPDVSPYEPGDVAAGAIERGDAEAAS